MRAKIVAGKSRQIGDARIEGLDSFGSGRRTKSRQDGNAEGPESGSVQWPVSVAISFQFGSREVTSRAKVQISFISTMPSGLPSWSWPSLP